MLGSVGSCAETWVFKETYGCLLFSGSTSCAWLLMLGGSDCIGLAGYLGEGYEHPTFRLKPVPDGFGDLWAS